jgi:nucleoside phosphorylase
MSRINTRLAARDQDASRHPKFYPRIEGLPDLPAINWDAIGATAPQPCAIPAGTPAGQLPAADIVVITWAEAEWAALEHVFIQSSAAMPYAAAATSSWPDWLTYDANMPAHPDAPDWSYWGQYRLVTVNGKTVLLFKSNTHLDWPGASFLGTLIGQMCQYVQPSLILSIGTAGGCRLTDHLGTVNVVNAATMYSKSEPPANWPTYTSGFLPAWSVIGKPGFDSQLFAIPASPETLQTLADQFNAFFQTSYPLSTLNADNLVTPDAQPALNNLTVDNVALLTASTFVVGTTSGNYDNFAVIEMDDAVIAQTCQQNKVQFGAVRNVSDTAQNAALPTQVQGDWGSAVYDVFGFYTSYNGALATWAIIAGMS